MAGDRVRRVVTGLWAVACVVALTGVAALAGAVVEAGQPESRVGDPKPLSHGTPQKQAPWQPGRSPYVTGIRQRPKYFVPPTNPRTPTWKMYGTPPGVVPGDWPRYAPLGFGGYRFPAVGAQAYR
jgi:hypothetical protein